MTVLLLRVTCCELRVTGCALRVAGYALRVASYGLRVTHFGVRVLDFLMIVRLIAFIAAESRSDKEKIIDIAKKRHLFLVTRTPQRVSHPFNLFNPKSKGPHSAPRTP